MRPFPPLYLLISSAHLATAVLPNDHQHNHQQRWQNLQKRQDPQQQQQHQPLQSCTDLTIASNNGDRKVAIVIDSSGSMSSADPDDLRLAAAKSLNDFLVSNAESGGEKKADQVAIVGFDSTPYDVFGPGDPGDVAASKGIENITLGGGTYIAGGVYQAMDHLAAMGGETKGRSAIVVFTDGSDSDTEELVSAINNATSQGIRVSFGYLDDRASAQPQTVLRALRDSRGVYATITIAAGSQNFINYVLLNGLTAQDNAQGAGDRLLAGLATTQFVSGSDPVRLRYTAERGENANFTVVSFTGDRLTVEARAGGQAFQSDAKIASTRQFLNLTVPGTGEVELLVTATNGPADGLFSVLTNSNQPIKNCTVGVTGDVKSGGLSTGAKAGVGIGVIAAVAGLAAAGFYAYKHFFATAAGASAAAPTISGLILSGAEGNIGGQGGEKIGGFADVSPVQGQIGGGGSTGGISLLSPTGYEGDTIVPNLNAEVHGAAPYHNASYGSPSAPSQPAFVPPLVPPLMKPPSNSHRQPSRPGSQHSSSFHPSPISPSEAYPSPPPLPEQYQQSLPHHHEPHHQTSINSPDPYHYQQSLPGSSFEPPHKNNYADPPANPSDTNNPQNPHKPTFPVPSPPSGWKQKSIEEKHHHHHHPWLPPNMACEHPDCPLSLSSHSCQPPKENCMCTCQQGEGCPYLNKLAKG